MKKQLQEFLSLNHWRLILLTMIIFIAPGAAFSQGIKTVTTNADDGAGSLRQVIADAVDGDIINFDGAVTTITVDSTLNLGGKTLTIDGGGDVILERYILSLDSFRVVTVTGTPDKVVTIKNLTIQNGFANGSPGGAIYADNSGGGKTILEDISFKDNRSNNAGGAVYSKGNSADISMVANCEFINNEAIGDDGGGIWADYTTISGCTFTENVAGDDGGAAWLTDGAFVDNSTFTGNTCGDVGGAIRVQDRTVTISSCTFDSNSAEGNAGGVFFARGTVYDSKFTNNISAGDGGAIYANQNECYFYNCTFSGNQALNGGAAWIDDGGLLSKCVVTNNSASKNGGGVYLRGDRGPGPALLVGSVIANNTADTLGGGLYLEKASVINSTIINNYAGENGGAFTGDGEWYITNSIVYGNDAAGDDKNIQVVSNSATEHAANVAIDATAYNAAAWIASNITTLDSSPFVGGSEADSLMLPVGSALIDAGDTTGLSVLLPETDLNGVKRVINDAIDLGVYERYVSLVVTTDADDGAGSLRQVIADALDGESLITFADDITLIKVDQPLELGDKSVIIDGGGDVVLDATFNADPALDTVRVMTITGNPDKVVTIKNLTIQNAFEKHNDGGGLYADHTAGGKTILENINFSSNTAFRRGGGLYLIGLAANPSEITNCEFTGNYVDNGSGEGDGGGIYAEFATVSGCTFTDNNAADDAGAIYANDEVEISNSTFTGNLAGDAGGAIRTGAQTIVISDCMFDGNSAGGAGGAVFMARGSLINCEILNNTSVDDGGGVYANQNECVIDNCLISGNSSSSNGGGAFIDDGGVLSNCVVTDNSAVNNGGGIYLEGTNATALAVGCLVANNTADAKGGGLYVMSADVINSIITKNYAGTNGGALTGDTGPWFIANSIVYGNDAAGTDKNIEFVSNSATDHAVNSAIDATAYNDSWTATNITTLDASPFVGGTGADSLYSANSALIDAGTLDYGIADLLPEFDLDGNNRIQGTIDLGVYETEIINVLGVTLDRSSLEVSVGETGTLVATVEPDFATDKSIVWSSSDESVATVEDGVVTGISEGSATITATTVSGGFTATADVTVKVAVTGVTLNEEAITLQVDETFTLVATVIPADATNQTVGWVSGNEDVATVDDNGVVTAVSAGTATISVVTLDGSFIATTEVTVSTVGLENFEAAFKVYPNPVRDILVIEGQNIRSVAIYSVIGKPVMIVEEGVKNRINLSAIESGMYLLKITTDKGTAVKTIIKE